MSQIKKSASFRSRIPIRRTKPLPRRCYSPDPYRRQASTIYTSPHRQQMHKTTYESELGPIESLNGPPQQKLKRQRHFVLASNQSAVTSTVQDTEIVNGGAIRPKTIYSSSSFSSSDESQESEAPIQVQNLQEFFLQV